MLACDLVVAADHATFGITEVQRGLAAGAGGLVRLPKRVGLAVALEMAMTGDPVDAATAQQLGLVNRSEEHTSEPQSLMRSPYASLYLQKKKPISYFTYNKQSKTT